MFLLQKAPQLSAIFDDVIRYKLLKSRWMESDLRLEPRYGADFCRYRRPLEDPGAQLRSRFEEGRGDHMTCHCATDTLPCCHVQDSSRSVV